VTDYMVYLREQFALLTSAAYERVYLDLKAARERLLRSAIGRIDRELLQNHIDLP
jgi:hypothetical protein